MGDIAIRYMSKEKILKTLKNYQKSGQMRRDYFKAFEKIMIYRTTKTENPKTSLKMVEKVFRLRSLSYDG